MDQYQIDQMRNYIILTENILPAITIDEECSPIEPAVIEENITPIIFADLSELVFKLRGFMETESGDYALGVETGMQRAADMIENLIKRHSQGDYIG